MGPSTAGKTTLMLGLEGSSTEYDFTVDRTWTTRPRRPNEDDRENIFVDPEQFEEVKNDMLFTFSTFPTYEYGIVAQKPLGDREARMRILTPVFAAKFRQLVFGPTILCAILPHHNDPMSVYGRRENNAGDDDLRARAGRFQSDQHDANNIADVIFQNAASKEVATKALASSIVRTLSDK